MLVSTQSILYNMVSARKINHWTRLGGLWAQLKNILIQIKMSEILSPYLCKVRYKEGLSRFATVQIDFPSSYLSHSSCRPNSFSFQVHSTLHQSSLPRVVLLLAILAYPHLTWLWRVRLSVVRLRYVHEGCASFAPTSL